jgi:hypothetical protein
MARRSAWASAARSSTVSAHATTVASHPWFALQQHSDDVVLWQFTGYRNEIDALAARLAITPEELPPISEQDFFARCRSEL